MHMLERKIQEMAEHSYAMFLITHVLKNGWLFERAAARCAEFKCPSPEGVRRLLDNASLWLDCAAKMDNIQFGLPCSEAPLLCRPAYEYEIGKGKNQSVFLSMYVRFHLLWNALETVGGLLFSADSSNRKTNVKKMIDYLGDIHFDEPSLLKIRAALLSCQTVMKQMDVFKNPPKFENFDEAICSLHMTKFLRNRYIHGEAFVPDSAFYEECLEHEILPAELNGHIAACRTTLLWMQAMLIDVANRTRCQMETTMTTPNMDRDKDVRWMFSTFLAKQHYRLFPEPCYVNSSLCFCDPQLPFNPQATASFV